MNTPLETEADHRHVGAQSTVQYGTGVLYAGAPRPGRRLTDSLQICVAFPPGQYLFRVRPWRPGSAMTSANCRLCDAELTETFVNLGMSPLCESYLGEDRLDAPEVYY